MSDPLTEEVRQLIDRVLTELVAKMREMKMDKSELGCLRAIVLFNPGQSVLGYCASPLLTRGALACYHRVTAVNLIMYMYMYEIMTRLNCVYLQLPSTCVIMSDICMVLTI